MKLFVDTASLDDLTEIKNSFNIQGVTTNPSLIAKEGEDYMTRIRDISTLFNDTTEGLESISIEVTEVSMAGMIDEALVISQEFDKFIEQLHEQNNKADIPTMITASMCTIKLPTTLEGLAACKVLTEEYDIRVNMTLIFSLTQAIHAINAGASYISPFIGRIDDLGYNGMQLIQDIAQYIKTYDYTYTQVIAASIRTLDHINQCAFCGCDIATIPVTLFHKMYKHTLTDQGLDQFMKDYEAAFNV